MAYVHTLDAAVPANSGLVSVGASNIRDLTAALIERLNSFFVDSNAQPLVGKAGASFAGALAITGDVAVNTNKFTVTAASGNTVVAGTLGVTGATTFSAAVVATGGLLTLKDNVGFTHATQDAGVFASSGTLYVGAYTAGVGLRISYPSGNAAFTGTLGVTGAVTLSSTLAVTSTINGQTISTAANFTGSLAIGGALTGVTTGAFSGTITLSGAAGISAGGNILSSGGNITGLRMIAGTDIASAVAKGVFGDGTYSASTDAGITSVLGSVTSVTSANASGTWINHKTQVIQSVATTGNTYASHNVGQATHTSGTVVGLRPLQAAAYITGSGGTTTTASVVTLQALVAAGTTVTSLNYIDIVAPSVSGTATNVRALNIGNMGTGSTKWAMTTGTGLVQLGDQFIAAASTTSRASIRIPSGTAPSSPLSDEVWNDGTAINFATSLITSGVVTSAGMISSGAVLFNAPVQLGSAVGTNVVTIGGAGYGAATASLRLNGLTTGAAAQAGTLTNSPVAGNPTFWAPISIDGVVKYSPLW